MSERRSTTPEKWVAPLFVLIAGAAFSLSGPLARYGRPVHPLMIAFGRLALASILLIALDVRGVIASVRALSALDRRRVLFAGLLLAAHFALFLLGLDATSLPAAIALVSLEPLSVVLVAWLMFGVRPTRLEGIGVLLATVGACVVATGAGAGEHRLRGDLMVVVAVALYGLYVGMARACRDALPARHYAPVVYGVAGLALAIVVALARIPPWPMPAHGVVAIVGLAIVPTVIGHTAVQTAARTLSPSTVALVSPGETLGGIVISMIFFRAIPTLRETIGAAIVLAGATLAILFAVPPPADEGR